MNPEFEIRERQTETLQEIHAFYKKVGYSGQVADADQVFLAFFEKQIVGAVRICKEEAHFVLRGMYVAPGLQRKGIGKLLLNRVVPYLDTLGMPTFCIPHGHLEKFYGRIGFKEIDSGVAPLFLASRLGTYRASGLAVILMQR